MEQPLAQLLREELQSIPDRVLAKLPDRGNLRKQIHYEWARATKPAIHHRFGRASWSLLPKFGWWKLLNPQQLGWRKSHRTYLQLAKNLVLLRWSDIWFLNRTFKISRLFFTRIFKILGTYRNPGLDSGDGITVRLANAVLSSKDLQQYQFVLRAMKNVAEEYRKSTCYPGHVMADFKWPSLMPVWRLRWAAASFILVDLCTTWSKLKDIAGAIQQLQWELKIQVHILLAFAFTLAEELLLEWLAAEVMVELLRVLMCFEETWFYTFFFEKLSGDQTCVNYSSALSNNRSTVRNQELSHSFV